MIHMLYFVKNLKMLHGGGGRVKDATTTLLYLILKRIDHHYHMGIYTSIAVPEQPKCAKCPNKYYMGCVWCIYFLKENDKLDEILTVT